MKWKVLLSVVVLAITSYSIYRFYEQYQRVERQAFVSDSILHVKEVEENIRVYLEGAEHRDSVKRERERKMRLQDSLSRSNTLVITCGDSVYHYTSNCGSILSFKDDGNLFYLYTENKESYRLITEEEALSRGYELCEDCYMIKWAHDAYEDGELEQKEDEEDDDAYMLDEDYVDKEYWEKYTY